MPRMASRAVASPAAVSASMEQDPDQAAGEKADILLPLPWASIA